MTPLNARKPIPELEAVLEQEEETMSVGARMSRTLLKKSREEVCVIALMGPLGAGKTMFSKGFAKTLGIMKITSPTFLVIKKYKLSGKVYESTGKKVLYHIDCYRLRNGDDLLDLDWREIQENPEHVVLIEWAEKVKDILPQNTTWLTFTQKEKSIREIVVTQNKDASQK